MAEIPADELAQRLLDAMMPHVPFDGWTAKAIEAAARDLGIDLLMAKNAFPGGGPDAIALHSDRADKAMVAALTPAALSGLKIREKIALAVRTRLEQAEADRESVRRAVQLLALPPGAPLAARLLARTVDAIWRGIGDESENFSFYSKRLILGGVYSATVAYWLQDDSEGRAKTWEFLDRRIDDVMQIGKLRARVEPLLKAVPSPFSALMRLRDAVNARKA
ncbi:COQ9 family protein [Zavarzinia compransoris]|uniref:COQ9 family protein n=1 Tax=Zavarzinia compransoris TaxID=1264899 RepID=A0A317E6N4_9PROT|nr:COQ9 family protein [Zavarzinia compransoris]PWR22281.1 COQ9 family protein [Zavarzinia compransoris]TDP46956.1 ubiquinone biosynthesis protein COQ9 [Zavarzinia compransoris]